MKLFRKVREKSLSKKNLGGYVMYASGEILLVIVGILLGLSLNKCNEERKQMSTLEADFKLILLELESDTLEARFITNYHLRIQDTLQHIIDGTVTEEELKACDRCLTVLSSIQPFTIDTRGYNLLKKYSETSIAQEDTLLHKIMDFYATSIESQEIAFELLSNNLERNLIDWQDNHPWFDEVFGKNDWHNEEYFSYLMNDEILRNKIAYQGILNYQNYVPMLEFFIKNAKEISSNIKERLDKK